MTAHLTLALALSPLRLLTPNEESTGQPIPIPIPVPMGMGMGMGTDAGTWGYTHANPYVWVMMTEN